MDEAANNTQPDTPQLEDVYGITSALEYVNARLAAEGLPTLTMVGFKRHMYDDPDRPGSLFQLEPIRLESWPDEAGRAQAVVFTRRMLDEYLAAREHNAARGVERIITRPTPAEAREFLSTAEAQALATRLLAERGVDVAVTSSALRHRGTTGELPRKVEGKTAVYTQTGIRALVDLLIEQGQEKERRRDPMAHHRRKPRGRAKAILEWAGADLDELRKQAADEE